ncbi:Uncharacterized protein OBRU01_06927, partial [Operophtera brumata]
IKVICRSLDTARCSKPTVKSGDGLQNSISFKAKPPLVLPLLTSTRFQTAPSCQMDQIIDKMVVEHVLEFAPETPSFLSTMFLTPKSDGSMHLIINLKRLNHLVQNKKFLSEKKIQGLQEVISRLLKRKQASLWKVQSIIGSLYFARLVVPGRLKFCCLLAHCNSLLQNYPERPYPLPFQSNGELKWWMLNCQKIIPTPTSTQNAFPDDRCGRFWMGSRVERNKNGGCWLDG